MYIVKFDVAFKIPKMHQRSKFDIAVYLYLNHLNIKGLCWEGLKKIFFFCKLLF